MLTNIHHIECHAIKPFIKTSSKTKSKQKLAGFTLLELLIAIAVLGILTAIALPSLNDFLVRMRVDNEISEIQRLLLVARNTAINTEQNTTICPLSGGTCTTNWENELSVFTNDSNTMDNNKYNAATEQLVKVKDAIKNGDKLQLSTSIIVYVPSGRTLSSTSKSFSYCPKNEADKSRGIDISISGRSYTSSDTDNDDKDENRNGSEITCI
ncbi:MAG: GspH/FimT family pseudopilin [Colwellia sp.]